MPTPSIIKAFEGLPIKLECTVQTNAQLQYKMVWMKGDSFITGNGYSYESTEFDSKTNTQNYYLTIHKASPGTYSCKLISTNMKLIEAKTQHVVTESKCLLSDCFILQQLFYMYINRCFNNVIIIIKLFDSVFQVELIIVTIRI